MSRDGGDMNFSKLSVQDIIRNFLRVKSSDCSEGLMVGGDDGLNHHSLSVKVLGNNLIEAMTSKSLDELLFILWLLKEFRVSIGYQSPDEEALIEFWRHRFYHHHGVVPTSSIHDPQDALGPVDKITEGSTRWNTALADPLVRGTSTEKIQSSSYGKSVVVKLVYSFFVAHKKYCASFPFVSDRIEGKKKNFRITSSTLVCPRVSLGGSPTMETTARLTKSLEFNSGSLLMLSSRRSTHYKERRQAVSLLVSFYCDSVHYSDHSMHEDRNLVMGSDWVEGEHDLDARDIVNYFVGYSGKAGKQDDGKEEEGVHKLIEILAGVSWRNNEEASWKRLLEESFADYIAGANDFFDIEGLFLRRFGYFSNDCSILFKFWDSMDPQQRNEFGIRGYSQKQAMAILKGRSGGSMNKIRLTGRKSPSYRPVSILTDSDDNDHIVNKHDDVANLPPKPATVHSPHATFQSLSQPKQNSHQTHLDFDECPSHLSRALIKKTNHDLIQSHHQSPPTTRETSASLTSIENRVRDILGQEINGLISLISRISSPKLHAEGALVDYKYDVLMCRTLGMLNRDERALFARNFAFPGQVLREPLSITCSPSYPVSVDSGSVSLLLNSDVNPYSIMTGLVLDLDLLHPIQLVLLLRDTLGTVLFSTRVFVNCHSQSARVNDDFKKRFRRRVAVDFFGVFLSDHVTLDLSSNQGMKSGEGAFRVLCVSLNRLLGGSRRKKSGGRGLEFSTIKFRDIVDDVIKKTSDMTIASIAGSSSHSGDKPALNNKTLSTLNIRKDKTRNKSKEFCESLFLTLEESRECTFVPIVSLKSKKLSSPLARQLKGVNIGSGGTEDRFKKQFGMLSRCKTLFKQGKLNESKDSFLKSFQFPLQIAESVTCSLKGCMKHLCSIEDLRSCKNCRHRFCAMHKPVEKHECLNNSELAIGGFTFSGSLPTFFSVFKKTKNIIQYNEDKLNLMGEDKNNCDVGTNIVLLTNLTNAGSRELFFLNELYDFMKDLAIELKRREVVAVRKRPLSGLDNFLPMQDETSSFQPLERRKLCLEWLETGNCSKRRDCILAHSVDDKDTWSKVNGDIPSMVTERLIIQASSILNQEAENAP